MIEWRRGGLTGSLNKWVRREVREQLRDNATARRAKHPLVHRGLRAFFSIGTFGRFIIIYVVIDALAATLELSTAWLAPGWLRAWVLSGSQTCDINALMTNVAGYLIAAQVGALAVISIAVALVSLIAQREGPSTDVQVYYHESLAFEVVASSIALLAVLCIQLVWPLQFLTHRLSGGTEPQAFKLLLFTVHITWLLLNLTGLAHFVATTLRFVQQSAREASRERYTANVVQPLEMTQRLRERLYLGAGSELLASGNDDENEHEHENRDLPTASFGWDLGTPQTVEIEAAFTRPVVLRDIRMTWVRWVLRRWSGRCQAQAASQPVQRRLGLGRDRPRLMFTPRLDQPLRGKVGWCQRDGGVPLDRFERFVLRRAFRFRSARDDG